MASSRSLICVSYLSCKDFSASFFSSSAFSLRHYLEQGIGKAELARRLDVSRRTLFYWIEFGQLNRELDGQPVQ